MRMLKKPRRKGIYGSIRRGGRWISELVFQEFELLEYLDVLDNILLPYRINAALALTSGVRERARGLADKVGIGDKLRRNVAHLSQGERQRAAICRALMGLPYMTRTVQNRHSLRLLGQASKAPSMTTGIKGTLALRAIIAMPGCKGARRPS